MRILGYIVLAGVSSLMGATAEDRRPAMVATAQVPLAFERATSGDTRWTARGNGYRLGVGAADVEVGLRDEQLRILFVGANAKAPSAGLDALPGKVNYFIGRDPKLWLRDIPTYGRVRYSGVYPGVDVVWYGRQGKLEYDLELQPGADASRIAMRFKGARKLALEGSGDLRVEMASGSLSLKLPEVYQDGSGGRKRIDCRYDLRAGNEVGFHLAVYDKSRPLVIDPTLVYATFFGSGGLYVQAMTVDSLGNVYIGGYTSSGFLPVVNPVQPGLLGITNAFISKFDPTGKTVLYSTYLGGSSGDYLSGTAVDSSGNLVGTGYTYSTDFPLVNAMQSTYNGNSSAFAFKLNAAGNGLVYSTYLAGGGAQGNAVALDGSSNAYFTGYEYNMQTTPGALNNCCRAFVVKLSSTGGSVYAALLGADQGNAITVDALGAAYVSGYSTRSSFPNNPPGAQTTNAGGEDAFVAKLSPDGSSLVWATFLGGSGYDSANAIALGTGNVVYFGGQTSSSNLPVTAGVIQGTYGGNTDAFVASLSADGTSFGFVTYLGGSRSDTLTSLALGSNGLIVAGNTYSRDFPVSTALQPAFPGPPYTLLKSTNSGATFTPADAGLAASRYNAILPDPSTAGVILLDTGDTGNGVFRSTDDGATWVNVEPNSDGSTARSLSNPSVVYTADYCSLYKSTDGGQTWNPTNNGCPFLGLTVGISPTDPNTVVLFYGSTEYRSTDGGQTFPQTIAIPWYAYYDGAGVVASPDGSLYAVTGYGLYKSADAGLTWTQLGTGVLPSTLPGFALSTSNPSILYASDGNNVYKSTNAGLAWSEIGTGAGVNFLAVDPSNPQNIYGTGTGGLGVLISTDGGATWTPTGALVDSEYESGIALNPSNGSEVYLGVDVGQTGFVAKLSNDGTTLTWSTYYGGYGPDPIIMGGAAPAPSGNVWVAGYGDGSLPLTPDARNGNVAGNGSAFLAAIADAAASCGYTINPGTQYSYAAGWLAFAVTAPSGCPWTATPSDTWIHMIRSSGAGSGTIPLAVDANTTTSTRTGTVTVNSQVYTIVQPPSSCTYTLSNPTLTSAGGTATITVTAPAGCPWDVELQNGDAVTVTSAVSSPASVTSSITGTGDGTVTLSIPPNFGVNNNSYCVEIGGQSSCIGEAGVPPAISSLSPSSAAPGGAAFTLTVNGTDFASGAAVNWNGTALSTTFVSLTQLTASVPASLIASAGEATVTVVNPGGATSGGAAFPFQSPLSFVPMTPCRVADTRYANGDFGSPSLAAVSSRSFTIPSSTNCSIPSTAAAWSLNVTVVPPPQGTLQWLTVWPSGQTQPYVSTLNSLDGRIKANAAIIPAGTGGAVSVYATNTTDLVLDIDGYFVPAASNASALAFYPLPPCRVADTRYASFGTLLGPPSLSAGQPRTFPVLSSSCNVPSTAQAYSLNFTAVPPAPFDYITTYPTGQTMPLASTLNDLTGTIVANAAIVPAGTGGSVSVYSSGATDLVIDINGYFAPPGTGGLSLYNLTPCRVLDTRQRAGRLPFSGEQDVNVAGSGCGAPAAAQAYVFNATVVPPGPLTWLTLWPQGGTMPVVSTLNALDGAITSNMAIVPTTNGSVSAYMSVPNTSYLILDIFGYFAP